jgi:hypothetical protein
MTERDGARPVRTSLQLHVAMIEPP